MSRYGNAGQREGLIVGSINIDSKRHIMLIHLIFSCECELLGRCKESVAQREN